MARALSSAVQLSQRFLRSVRVDADYGRTDALEGFVLQPSARLAIENLARHINETQQRAFTWTGPYGGGKSSLALALCSLVHPDKRVQSVARRVLNLERGGPITKAFDAIPNDGWTVLPVVGKRSSVTEEIARAIDRLPYRRKKTVKSSHRNVISELVSLAESPSRRGVLLLIDELGKFLETSARSGSDIYFYQELAEAACRAGGKLVVVGILHQAFEQYATTLGRDARDEWAKVQGRFVDISLAAGADETIDLIGRAIESGTFRHAETRKLAEEVSTSIGSRRPGTAKDLDIRLDKCWPLHPVTAALLGPSSKRRFGQNERSIFSFLNSVEPVGFREFLEGNQLAEHSYYWPWQFWDYLRANLEPAILASPDGHRWALGLEAVERAEAKGESVHVHLVKVIALIELFRNGSGIAADEAVLKSCFPSETAQYLANILEDLKCWSIIIFRRHLSAWGVYAGSDFDIEAAAAKARAEISSDSFHAVVQRSELSPVLAKRIYQQTGAMRFLARTIIRADEAEGYVNKYKSADGSCGEFVLILPGQNYSLRSTHALAKRLSATSESGELVIGVPHEADRIVEANYDLFVLKRVYTTSTELESDKVAAREIDARIGALAAELEELLRASFISAKWFWRGSLIEQDASCGLSVIASSVVETRYPESPVLLSELINRETPSSNSVKARRDLMHRMLSHAHEENLGYKAFPPDAGMYYSILKATALHRKEDGLWAFRPPISLERGKLLKPLWRATDKFLLQNASRVTLDSLYRGWSAPPYGVKGGILPILALAYFLANRRSLALYHEGVFTPELTDVHIDEWLQDSKRIEWRFVQIETAQQAMLDDLSTSLSLRMGTKVAAEPLDSARALVSFVLGLPEWTKRTTAVSEQTQLIRQSLLKANDPHRVLFLDLPALLCPDRLDRVAGLIGDCLAELANAYPKMLHMFEQRVFDALDQHSTSDQLRNRGRTVSGISGDFRLDAFALRLANYADTDGDIEGLIALAVNKPPREWTDRDIEAALIQLGIWAMDFRRVETLAPLRDRPATRHAIAVVFGPAAGNKTISRSFDVASEDQATVTDLVGRILSQRPTGCAKQTLFLAALAEVGATVAEQDDAGD